MVIDCMDSIWDEYLGKFPLEKQDIYYTAKYYQMGQFLMHGSGQMFVCEGRDGDIALYPFIKRPVVHPYTKELFFDIETAYGYGGPLVKGSHSGFIRKFEEQFLDYCRSERIIAEFVRFHPLLRNETVFRNHIQVLHNRSTVWIDLDKDLEAIWMEELTAQNRNTIRKCEKNGLYVKESHDYQAFMDVYNETMEKVGAGEFYFFQSDYYDAVRNDEHYILLEVKQGDHLLAVGIFMGYGEFFHYHLSGSRKDFLRLAPNNLLLWEAVRYAKQLGYKKMHLGGGRTDSIEDSLFRFKSRFSSSVADFYIGKRIHDQEVYGLLVREWEKKHGQKLVRLLQYRE